MLHQTTKVGVMNGPVFVGQLADLQPGFVYRLTSSLGVVDCSVKAVTNGIVQCTIAQVENRAPKPIFHGKDIGLAWLHGWVPTLQAVADGQHPLFRGPFTSDHLLLMSGFIPGDPRPLSQLVGPNCSFELIGPDQSE